MPRTTQAQRYRRELRLIASESRAWEPIHRAAREGIEFLIDGMHYEDSGAGESSKNSSEIRWVGEEAFHRLRHEMGAVTAPGHLTARPVDEYGDNDLAELAVRLVESDTENPAKEFEDSWYDIVGCGSAGGYGVGWLDYLPDEGPWGEIIHTAEAPDTFMCDRRVKSVHSPRCRFVIRRMRMTIGEAKRRCDGIGKWKRSVVNKLRPDDGHDVDALSKLAKDNAPNVTLRADRGADTPATDDDEREFTAYVVMRRRADDTEERKDYNDFEPEDRYMRCTSCGYRTERQGQLPPNDDGSEQELPEALANGCPHCLDSPDSTRHGDMVRIDGEETRMEMLAYPRGYMCILAPYALPGIEEFLYEGEWPWKLRSYPCSFLPRFRHPFKIVGPSIATLTWWNQTSTDMLMRLALERMVASAPFRVWPIDGLEDARGQRFEGSDENGVNAFYTGENPPAVRIEAVDPGIPAVWNPIYQAAQRALTGHTGTADLSIGETQTRDIAASSLALQVKQEEIPVADYKRRYQRQRGLLIGVYYDMIRAVYPSERLYRLLGPDAEDAVRAMAATDLPNFDFHFDSTPDLQPQDEAQQRGLELLLQTIEQRPWAVDAVVSVNHISPALARKTKAAFTDAQQKAAADAAAAAGQTAPTQPAQAAGAEGQQEPPSAMVARLLSSVAGGGAPAAPGR